MVQEPRENLEKQSSPKLVSPSFSYTLPWNLLLAFAELNFTCSKDQPWAGVALLNSAESWSWNAPFCLDFAELSEVWSSWHCTKRHDGFPQRGNEDYWTRLVEFPCMAEVLGAWEEGEREGYSYLNFFARQCKGISNYKDLQRLLMSPLLLRCKKSRGEPLEMLVVFTPLKSASSSFPKGGNLDGGISYVLKYVAVVRALT